MEKGNSKGKKNKFDKYQQIKSSREFTKNMLFKVNENLVIVDNRFQELSEEGEDKGEEFVDKKRIPY